MWLKPGFVFLVRVTAGLESDGLGRCVSRKGKSEVRRECAGLPWEPARDLLGNSGWRESSWGKSIGGCVAEGAAELHLLRDGHKPQQVLLGLSLAPGLLTKGNFSVSTAAIRYLSSSFWALHRAANGWIHHRGGFVAVIRIETCHVLLSILTFGHGFLSLHFSQRSICLFLTASACWADVFRELSAATPRSFSCVVTINLKFSNV